MHEDDLIPLKHTYLVTLHCRVWKKFMHLRTNSWFTISVGIEVWIEGVLMNTLFVGLLHHASYIGLWLPIMSIGFFQPASNYLWAKNVTLQAIRIYDLFSSFDFSHCIESKCASATKVPYTEYLKFVDYWLIYSKVQCYLSLYALWK